MRLDVKIYFEIKYLMPICLDNINSLITCFSPVMQTYFNKIDFFGSRFNIDIHASRQ